MPLLILGGLLVALAPVVGLLPGPGGIFLFAGGLVLLLRNSAWIKRHYARLTRKYPRLGRISNRALRRESARRRRLRDAPAPGVPD
ncbi:hypothetical protein [Sphingomonas bacterium]|uniref:hypothetical protein n=1 Tax=Sphingomonas bacterium TaxID=1895847 RepID=UPI0020C6329C|nr:hypothetical protein [Sphingomonas bacterium]